MRYESKTGFAKRAGVSRQAIHKAIERGDLIVCSTGKLDVKNKINAEYLSKKNEVTNTGGKQAEKPTIKEEKAKPKPKKPTTEKDPAYLDYDPDDLTTLSNSSANRLKTISQIRKNQVDTNKARLALVSRETIQKVFSKLYMIDVNQWRTLGPSIIPEIASIFGNDDNEKMIQASNLVEKEVFTILKQVKRIMNDFMKEIKAEEIK